MPLEHKILSFELKAASSDGSEFEGYANAFHTIDSAQEIVAPGCFTDTLPQFLSDGFIGGLNHNWDDPIGKPMEAKEDAKGLYVKAKIAIDTEEANKCRQLIKQGIVKKMSIGYSVKGREWLETAEDVAAYWQTHSYQPNPSDVAAAQYGARLLTKVHLYEFSPVTVPANKLADITRVKTFDIEGIETERDFEKFLRDAGFARDAARTIASAGFKGLRQRDAEETQEPDTAALQAAQLDYLVREARRLGVAI